MVRSTTKQCIVCCRDKYCKQQSTSCRDGSEHVGHGQHVSRQSRSATWTPLSVVLKRFLLLLCLELCHSSPSTGCAAVICSASFNLFPTENILWFISALLVSSSSGSLIEPVNALIMLLTTKRWAHCKFLVTVAPGNRRHHHHHHYYHSCIWMLLFLSGF